MINPRYFILNLSEEMIAEPNHNKMIAEEKYIKEYPLEVPELQFTLNNRQRLLQVAPVNNMYLTFSATSEISSGKKKMLKLFSRNGTILDQKQVITGAISFKTLTEDKIIIENREGHLFYIVVIDTEDSSRPLLKLNELPFPQQIFRSVGFAIFSQSQWLCVWFKVQITNNKENSQLKFSFYDIRQIADLREPTYQLQQGFCCPNEWKVDKINENGKLAWWSKDKFNQKQPLTFQTLTLNTPYLRQTELKDLYTFETVKTINTFSDIPKLQKVDEDIAIREIWYTKGKENSENGAKDKRFLIYTTTYSFLEAMCLTIEEKVQNEQTIRTVGIMKNKFWMHVSDYLIFMGAYTIVQIEPNPQESLRKGNKEGQNVKKLRLFNNQTEGVLLEFTLHHSPSVFFRVDHQARRIIYTVQNNQEIEVRSAYVPELKEVYINMLEHLNEDFDDDLIMDALKLLVNDVEN